MIKKEARNPAIVIFLIIGIILFSLFFLRNFKDIFGLTTYEFVNEDSNKSNEIVTLETNQSTEETSNKTLIEELNKTEIAENETNLTEVVENITLTNITEVNLTGNISLINVTGNITLTNITDINQSIVKFNKTSITEENITNLAQENLTEANITGNISISVNLTILEDSPTSKVIINLPVRWTIKVLPNQTNVSLDIHLESYNISVNKILNNTESKVDPKNITVEDSQQSPNLITGAFIVDFGKAFFSEFSKSSIITGLFIYSFVNEEFLNQTTSLNETDIGDKESEGEIEGAKNKTKDPVIELFSEKDIDENETGYEGESKEETNITEDKEKQKERTKKIIINEKADQLEIDYYIPGPEVIEETIKNGKRITIFSEINFTDVLAYTTIWEVSPDMLKLYHITPEGKKPVNMTLIDTNNNSKINFVEWNVPHLSNQTYELIVEISNALHLDSNRDFISVIYEEVKEKDNIWSEPVYTNEFVRINFTDKLNSNQDISVYIRNNDSNQPFNTAIEVYYYNSTKSFAQFPAIKDESYYKIDLTNMTGLHREFDLKIISPNFTFLEFDHIIDPSIGNLSCEVANSGAFPTRTEVLRLSNRSNAHASLPNQTDYSLSIYCQDTTGRNTLGNSSGKSILLLSNATNAHVAESNTSDYNFNAYISSNPDVIAINYTTGSGVCGNGETCIATISNVTNAHISDCTTDPYRITICAGFLSNITAPSFSGSVNNTGFKRYFNASMNLTITDNTDISNYTFSWNESGSFVNDTTVQLAGTQTTWFVNISKNVTNALYNQIVQWRVYFCDPLTTVIPQQQKT